MAYRVMACILMAYIVTAYIPTGVPVTKTQCLGACKVKCARCLSRSHLHAKRSNTCSLTDARTGACMHAHMPTSMDGSMHAYLHVRIPTCPHASPCASLCQLDITSMVYIVMALYSYDPQDII